MSYTKNDLARFAEALANEKSIPAAAVAAGFSASFGPDLYDRVCRDLGYRQAR